MIAAAHLAAAAQVSVPADPKPMIVEMHVQPSVIPAISWECQPRFSNGDHASLTGEFPRIPAEAQNDGRAFHLSAQVKGTGQQADQWTGTFAAALTFNDLSGTTQYSVMVPARGSQPLRLLKFEFYRDAQKGFVEVIDFSSEAGSPMPSANGLCTTKVTP